VSTVFTQLNQYHVILEVDPEFQVEPRTTSTTSTSRRRRGSRPAERRHPDAPDHRADPHQPHGPVPGDHRLLQPGPGASLGAAVKAIQKVEKDLPQPPAMEGSFQGTAQAFVGSLTNEPILILSALVTVYIVLGVLYESYIHPITILSTLPSAGVGPSSRC
jgi:multidrug efflux pump